MTKKKSVTNTPHENLAKVYYNIKDPAGYGGVAKLKHHPNAKKWLASQPTYSLHKPLLRRFPTRKYKSSGLNEVWQMDLMEMIPYASINQGNKYILTCIDIFSRFARAQPTKSKEGKEIAGAVDKLFATGNVTPRHVQTDKGKEFYNKHVQGVFSKHDINHYTVNSQFKAALVERFNRTLREKLNRYFTHTGKKRWVDVLQDIIKTYNKTPHRGIQKRKPVNIGKENEFELWHSQQQPQSQQLIRRKTYNLTDNVRISRIADGPFKKNFDQNWSEEIFTIIGIDKRTSPVMYILEDFEHSVIQGKFYHEELQVVSKPEVYRIEKIIKTRGVGKNKQYFVKWYGYSSLHNSWISEKPVLGV